MNRSHLQQLALDRVDDAQVLLAAQRWAAAYHLVGYSLECGLKACILAHLEKTGMIFKDRNYLKALADCWTHDPVKLVELAGLTSHLRKACDRDPALAGYWGVAKEWRETSRYELKVETEARSLYEALTNEQSGVLRWIQEHW
jgi:hypothetical protein